MSYVPGLISILLLDIALMLPGFLVAYSLRFRSRTWGAVLLSVGSILALGGWLAAFSWPGVGLLVSGMSLVGAGAEGLVRRPGRQSA